MKRGDTQFPPSLLRYGRFTGYFEGIDEKPVRWTKRICYDYEIEYYTKSDGGVWIDGKFVPFSKGDISVRKPGQCVAGVPPYNCYVLCFDACGSRYLPDGYLFGDAAHAQPLYDHPVLNALPSKLSCPHEDRLIQLFEEIEWLLALPEQNQLKINALTQYLIADIAQSQRDSMQSLSKTNRYILKAIGYIREHFTEEISISELIASFDLSKAYFNRTFKESCGQTPHQMILSLRMEKAGTLLQISDFSVTDIAKLCGFSDSSYFTLLFKRTYGCTPTVYRENFQITVGGNEIQP